MMPLLLAELAIYCSHGLRSALYRTVCLIEWGPRCSESVIWSALFNRNLKSKTPSHACIACLPAKEDLWLIKSVDQQSHAKWGSASGHNWLSQTEKEGTKFVKVWRQDGLRRRSQWRRSAPSVVRCRGGADVNLYQVYAQFSNIDRIDYRFGWCGCLGCFGCLRCLRFNCLSVRPIYFLQALEPLRR